MALKTLLTKEGRRERALTKAIAKAAHTKMKPDDRRPALQLLIEDGGEAAIAGLLRRMTFNYDTNIVADEEEKNYVYECLVDLGERVLPPLREHLRTAPTLSWGLRLLKEIAPGEVVWEAATEVLSRFEPGYERDPSRKQQVLSFLGELDHPGVSEVIAPFLGDHDETVRFLTIEALLKRAEETVAREPLLALLVSEEEESLRIKNRIAEGFSELGWAVKGYRGTAESVLSDEFAVDGKGRIKKKKGRG